MSSPLPGFGGWRVFVVVVVENLYINKISFINDEQMFPPNLGTVESVDFHISIISILGQLNFNIIRLKSDM